MSSAPLLAVVVLVSYAAVALFRAGAARAGLLDRPDRMRKLQDRPIPVGGGAVVAIIFAVVLTLAALGVPFPGSEVVSGALSQAPIRAGVVLAGIIVLTGAVDDRWRMSGLSKSVAELPPIVATALAFGAPVAISAFGGEAVLGRAPVLLLASFWLFGCVNSFNLLDGADGFVSVLSVACLATLAAVAATQDMTGVALLCGILIAALVGFLFHNAPPAKVYLGDSGSLSLGFVVGVFALAVFRTHGVFRPIPALCLLTLPILDSTCAIARRRNAGRSVFSPDLSHLHHCLQRRFGRGYRTLVALAVIQTPLCLGAFFGVFWNNDLIPLTASVAVVGSLAGFGVFGRDEARSTLRRFVSLHQRLFRRADYDVEGRLLGNPGSEDWRPFWREFLAEARSQGGVFVQLSLNLPFAGVDWQGEWRARRLDVASTRGARLRGRVGKKRRVRDSRIKFELPLQLDSAVVGTLRLHFDAREQSFADAADRVKILLGMCADALDPFGRRFRVDSLLYVRRLSSTLRYGQRESDSSEQNKSAKT